MNESQTPDWQERAAELQNHGVPERRAEVVALLEEGLTHTEVAETLDLNDRSNVGVHVARYREARADAKWLADHGPDV